MRLFTHPHLLRSTLSRDRTVAFASTARVGSPNLSTHSKAVCSRRPLHTKAAPRSARLQFCPSATMTSPPKHKSFQPVKPSERYGTSPGLGLYEFEVDAAGYEKALPSGGRASDEILEAIAEGVDDVVIVSHGWSTTRNDEGVVPFSHNMVRALNANNPKEGRRVLYVGIHWQSHPMTAIKMSGKDVDKARYEDAVKESSELREEKPDRYWDVVKDALGETDPKAARKLGEIAGGLAAARLSKSDTVPDDVKEKIAQFAEHLSPEAEKRGSSSLVDAPEHASSAAIVLDKTGKLAMAAGSAADLFGPVQNVAKNGSLTLSAIVSFFRNIPLLGNLFGLTLLPAGALTVATLVTRALERIVFGQFQRRASIAGSRGVHVLISQMMDAAKDGTRFHCIAHSLGCHLVSSAAIGGEAGCLLPRKLHSMTLLQGAVPKTNYEKGGPYKPLSSVLMPVAGPVIATTSQRDLALDAMEIFNGPTLGRNGFDFRGAKLVDKVLKKDKAAVLGFEKGTFYTVKADAVIDETSSWFFIDLDGAHGDLLDEELLLRVWEGIDVQVDDADLKMPEEFPKGYWENTVLRNAL